MWSKLSNMILGTLMQGNGEGGSGCDGVEELEEGRGKKEEIKR